MIRTMLEIARVLLSLTVLVVGSTLTRFTCFDWEGRLAWQGMAHKPRFRVPGRVLKGKRRGK